MSSRERGEQVAVVISLTDLGYPKPTWEDAKAIVRGLNRDAALVVLAQFNLFLAIASIQTLQHNNLKTRR